MVLVSFLTILALSVVHIAAGAEKVQRISWSARTLSFAAGISASYVFLDLLPDLSNRQAKFDHAGLFSVIDRHVYVLALVGLAVAFWVETAARASRMKQRNAGLPDQTDRPVFWLSIASFVVLNAAIGYAVGRPGDDAVSPLWLFAIALGLHFFVNDHSLVEHHGKPYQKYGRWWLAGGLVLGWVIGATKAFDIPDVALAFVLSYIAGGTLLNILRHELPDTSRSGDVTAFALGAVFYTGLLLMLG